ncbi:MAG: hypothetical protein EOM77_04080 [Bacteroidia bacterium]|nr:hypothetical protein [Bacteroidia bacterium]
MRRLIAYLTLAVSTIIAIGVGINPVMSKGVNNLDYRDGRQFVYQLFNEDDAQSPIEEEDAAKDVAATMDSRLKTWGVSNYSVEIDGNDIIRVSLTAKNDTEYDYLKKYLGFSGQDFSIATKDEKVRLTHDQVFVDSVAYIVYEGYAPYVIIPLSNPSAFKALVNSAEEALNPDADEPQNAPSRKADGEETSSEPNVFLWANWDEGEDFEKAQDDEKVANKIVAQFLSSNIYYDDSDVAESEIKYLSGFADSEGNYDTSKIQQANNLANYVKNLFNSTAYDYEVTNIFTTTIPANVESILTYGMSVNLSASRTLIATIVVAVVVGLVLAFFFRIGSIAVITSTAISFFATLAIFVAFGAEFNIAGLIALIFVAAASLLAGVMQLTKFKEEVYRGRNFKKANTESAKAMTLPSIDLAVIMAFVGVLSYIIGGSLVASFGTMLVIGAIAGLVVNLVILRLMLWLVTNTTALQGVNKVFNIDGKNVPNLLKEEKQTYFGPYQDRNFTKQAKPVAIGVGAFSAVALIMMIVFGALNGSIYNVNAAYEETSKAYITIVSDSPVVDGVSYIEDNILAHVYVDGKLVTYGDIDHETRDDYDAETTITTTYNYYIVNFDELYTGEEDAYFLDGDVQTLDGTLEEVLDTYVDTIEGGEGQVRIKLSANMVTQPSTTYIALGALAGVALAVFYLAFRYRVSRALAALGISAVASFATLGFFVITRIATTPIVALVIPAIALFTLFASLYFLTREKDLLREDRSKEKTAEVRKAIMVKATALAAGPLFIFGIIMSYFAINYFGFGPASFAALFGGMLLGVALAVLLVVTLLGPTALLVEGLITKIAARIRLPRLRLNKKKAPAKSTSSEPEETIFIGIND